MQQRIDRELALNFLLIPLCRAGARQLLDDLDLWQRPAVNISTGENARDAYLAIKSKRSMGYCILGFVRHCEEVQPTRQSMDRYSTPSLLRAKDAAHPNTPLSRWRDNQRLGCRILPA